MTANVSIYSHCSGKEDVDTLGNSYLGTYSTTFLSNSKEGKEIFDLLEVYFDRKLAFIVGTSLTKRRTNTMVWNGVHHKNNLVKLKRN